MNTYSKIDILLRCLNGTWIYACSTTQSPNLWEAKRSYLKLLSPPVVSDAPFCAANVRCVYAES